MTPSMDKIAFIEKLQNWGASIVRIADTAKLSEIDTEPRDLLNGFPRAVSIAVHLSDPIMDMIDTQPAAIFIPL